MGVHLTTKYEKIEVDYNNINLFLDQRKGGFLVRDFSEVVLLEDDRAVQVIKTNGKPYYFTVEEPNEGQMTSIPFRQTLGGQPVLALPVESWNGKPVTSNEELFDLIWNCV